MRAKLTILGSGTSQGVPMFSCDCHVCNSPDPHDKRLRTSALVEMNGMTLVVDAGPDFREQMIRAKVKHIDGILLTMVDSRTNNAKEVIEALRSGLGQSINVFNSEIPRSVRATECSILGESIFSHDKNGKVAAAYEALTKEVTELEGREKARPGPNWVR